MARPLVATKPPRSSTVDAAVEPPRRRRRSGRRRALVGWLYATPTAVMVGLFFLVPMVLVGWMSLHRWPLLREPELNFPDNYTGAADNDLIRDAAWFTAKYTVVITVLLFVLAFVLALLVQRRRRGVGFFRTAFILPMAGGFASASLLFLGMPSDEIGPVNKFLASLGLIDGYTSWTSGSPNSALGSAILLVLWRFAGFMMLILLTGLQAIPVELYEATRVDGASRWQTFRQITLPLMRPIIALVLTLLHAVRPGLITVALFAFLVSWNEFFAPLILLNSTDRFTMTLAVVNMRTATHGSIDYAALEAGVVVMAVPCLLLFLFMQRGYVRGFMSGALKG